MSELDTSNIASYYAQMSEHDFNYFVLNNAAGLRAEIIPVVEAEMKRRGMDMELFKQVENRNRIWTDEELNTYCELFRDFECPVCKQHEGRLNAALIQTVNGVILMTFTNQYIQVGCMNCLNKSVIKALLITLPTGWWSKNGFLHTPDTIYNLIRTWRANGRAEPSKAFRKFVSVHIDFIQQCQQRSDQLHSLIQQKTIL